jgi:hypothetical protein
LISAANTAAAALIEAAGRSTCARRSSVVQALASVARVYTIND